jgi:DNA integrity scanning protein DisA with diadenylate cyclase activity
MANTGQILAYGAVLDPQRKGRVRAAEGSRTKAAIGASNYGLAIKVSSDGDITVYAAGKQLIKM